MGVHVGEAGGGLDVGGALFGFFSFFSAFLPPHPLLFFVVRDGECVPRSEKGRFFLGVSFFSFSSVFLSV